MQQPLVTDELVVTKLQCYHCGQPCEETLWLLEKVFCCYGCKTVYEILSANDLCEYYALDKSPGVDFKKAADATYGYLDDEGIRKKVIEFDSETFTRVRFHIPAIHCISCIWLLEKLQRLEKGILKSEVNFGRKSVVIDFDPQTIKLSKVAKLLSQVGYVPHINIENEKQKPTGGDSLVLKLAIAGFCFSNVMLFSFPEYLGLDHSDQGLQSMFSWLNFFLSLPALFYSGIDYFRSAWRSFKQKQINIDVPIAAGLVALFLRSTWDIVTGFGPGYLDSFTGLIFFLLIGRWFQSKTYESLAFDRDFKSYFPLAVQKFTSGEWKAIVIYKLRKGDQIKVRNMEIIPADCLLCEGTAYIDYSFVTGESRPVKVKAEEIVYAGGRLIGQPATFTVEKKTSQSHLTSLWNHEAFRKLDENNYQKIIDRAARKFTWAVLAVAGFTAVYWQIIDSSQMWLVITSVLMVACPCALALAAPFTFGSMLRVFGRNQLYLKNADVIERLASIDAVVFDKTGTLTTGKTPAVRFNGTLTPVESSWIKLLTSYSTHPLSVLLTKSLSEKVDGTVLDFKELANKGIEGNLDGNIVRIGSASFVGYEGVFDPKSSNVFVSINNSLKGYYSISTSVREDIKAMLDRLGKKTVALLSGDNEADKATMETIFSPSVELLFNQNPHDKLEYVRKLQQQGRKVLMVGDGVNDAGALKQSDVGIAVTDDTGVFTPACDGILEGDRIGSLDQYIELAKTSASILKTGFLISFIYNAIALSFAVTGHLTPLTAAVLMPLSSVSVVTFSSLAVNYVSTRRNFIIRNENN
jgi:Cu+-exporting ATPase